MVAVVSGVTETFPEVPNAGVMVNFGVDWATALPLANAIRAVVKKIVRCFFERVIRESLTEVGEACDDAISIKV